MAAGRRGRMKNAKSAAIPAPREALPGGGGYVSCVGVVDGIGHNM